MRIDLAAVAAAAFICPAAALAQAEPAAAPVVVTVEQSAPVAAVVRAVQPAHALAANTEIFMTLNQELSSKRNKEGEMFGLTISHDVMLGQFVVIPKGTPAFGEVTWKTGRAIFGKSGKMDVELRYIDLNGRRIPITGKYRQEGEGTTLAAVGAVVLAAPLMVITGKSARIPEGREFKAFTRDALPVTLPEGAVVDMEPVAASAPAATAPAAVASPTSVTGAAPN